MSESKSIRRTPDRRRGSGAETRTKLIQSARHLGGIQSVNDITVEGITRGADVSRAAFYMYFENKAQICHEIARDAQAAFLTGAADFEPGSELQTTIERGTGAFVISFRRDRPGMRMLYDLSYAEPNIRALVHELRAQTYARWVAVLQHGIDTGQCRDLEPEGVARLLCGMMETFCVRSMRTDEYQGTGFDAPRGASAIAELWWRAVQP